MLSLLRQPRALTAAGLVALCVLAWLYVLGGAGSGMSAWQMTLTTLFPHRLTFPAMSGMDMPMTHWDRAGFALTLAMWWIMMIAMMTPGAAPAILLYAGARKHAIARGDAADSIASSGLFAGGYLLVWLLFSACATTLQWALVRAGLLSAQMMASQSRWLSAALLLAAGAYQLAPFKNACLTQCRSPAAFIARHARPGTLGALRLGVLHGAWCVGCCGLLMALLFVGGVMNVVWIVALAVLVMAEKLLPGGRLAGQLAGGLLLAWGVATLFM
jgi:predicted metal-binding membrane protein